MTRDPGTLQYGLQGTGTHGVILVVDLDKEAGVLHSVSQDLAATVMLVDLHIQVSEGRSFLDGLEMETSGGGLDPAAVLLTLPKELEKLVRIFEVAAEAVRIHFAFRHCCLPTFQKSCIFNPPMA